MAKSCFHRRTVAAFRRRGGSLFSPHCPSTPDSYRFVQPEQHRSFVVDLYIVKKHRPFDAYLVMLTEWPRVDNAVTSSVFGRQRKCISPPQIVGLECDHQFILVKEQLDRRWLAESLPSKIVQPNHAPVIERHPRHVALDAVRTALKFL